MQRGRTASGTAQNLRPCGKFGAAPGGGNSTVESHSSKVMVAGSNPVPRSKGLERMWFAYALQSKVDGWLYIGMSSDVRKCLEQHNRGYNRSTRSRLRLGFFMLRNVVPERKRESGRNIFEERKRTRVLKVATQQQVADGCGLPAAGRVQIPSPRSRFCSAKQRSLNIWKQIIPAPLG